MNKSGEQSEAASGPVQTLERLKQERLTPEMVYLWRNAFGWTPHQDADKIWKTQCPPPEIKDTNKSLI